MRRAHVLGLVLACAATLALAMPAQTRAATDMFYPRPLLPQGAPATACPAVAVSNIKVSVYDGALHTFEATLSDASYVAVAGAVGSAQVPFQFIQRIPAPHGGVAMRVHVQTTPVRGALPVSLTVLSAKPGQPVCAGIVLFTLTGSAQGSVGTSAGAGAGTSAPSAPASGAAPAKKPVSGVKQPSKTPTPGTGAATSAPATTTGPQQASGFCTAAGAFQLWLALIVLYAIATAVVALREPPLARSNRMLPTYLILTPLVILLVFWLFAVTCRSSGWVPLLLIIIAAAGVLYSYSEGDPSRRAVLLLSEEGRNGSNGPGKKT